ncbi:protein-PII uridylyltransferase [Legionella rubrilucens]|uniref:Bifunctional uridylyltransferase/uridylyl-removing enzyme n=1 Tax=Legionella rubrilucens TaxID=458 RepID=A0A0W0Y1Z3_9GAMM|nr:[protein-PII] uridylyltransferase [Legionella rubrilucens]KTD50628.1 protein-PII uridylyltransferase [Legionella rubrilucens]
MKNGSHVLKQTLKQFKEELCNEFCQKASITSITRKLVRFIDETLLLLFQKHQLHEDNAFCLLALGSYGRRELQLHSDIDLLLLHSHHVTKPQLHRAQAFIQDCWDIGLDVSHQITTPKDCADLASQDLSVISSILDMHLLCGRGSFMEELQYYTHPLHIWPSHEFFFAKQQEQKQRYIKYGETAYNLEPNVKQGAGGLRDLQILLSIGKRHFGIKKLADGISSGFITDKEYEQLINYQHFLWRIRFGLHTLAGKQEERLLFDYQVKLAALFGFEDTPQSLAIEQFMKLYFKNIKGIRELNEMLLHWFSEAIVHREKQLITPLDSHFQLSNHYIEVKHPRVFIQHPPAIIELFVWLAKRPDIAGVRASTIRLIRQCLFLMDKKFRSCPLATQLFIQLFKEKNPYYALHHMNRYGVLGHYLDCFAAVTGQMQYDLFHVYTVDQHTLFVIRNLVRFLDPAYNLSFPLAASLMAAIKKRELLYLAALFHDIAKGRGGDHSELGAEEAKAFAVRHQLIKEDADLVIWLVRHHLLMSQTAQRQDIYDPKTISLFCQHLPKPHYLDYLYLLTVADICATNHTLWNSWKDSLLKELYHAAHRAQQQEKTLPDEESLISERKREALVLLRKKGIEDNKVNDLWTHIKGKYFLHEPPDVIARHTEAMLSCQQYPLIIIMPHHSQGGTEVFIYMPHREERFTITTTVLSNHYITIQEATILTCDHQFDLDTYIILDEQHQALTNNEQIKAIHEALKKHLGKHSPPPKSIKRRLSRTQAHFKFKPQISFTEAQQEQHTCLFLVTTDRPGLLATVSRIFSEQGLHLHNAKIATAGERVEDMFYISTQAGLPLNAEEKKRLRSQLMAAFTNVES